MLFAKLSNFMIPYLYLDTSPLFLQVLHVVRLSKLIQSLQEERASVALNMFINRTSSLDTLDDLQQYVKVDQFDKIDELDIKDFSFRKVIMKFRKYSNKKKKIFRNLLFFRFSTRQIQPSQILRHGR